MYPNITNLQTPDVSLPAVTPPAIAPIAARLGASLARFRRLGANDDSFAARAVANGFAEFFSAALPGAPGEVIGALVTLCVIECAKLRLEQACGESAIANTKKRSRAEPLRRR